MSTDPFGVAPPRPTAPRGARVAPLVALAATLVCLAQLRHLEVGAEGGLVWNLPLALVLASLALLNGAVWLLRRELARGAAGR